MLDIDKNRKVSFSEVFAPIITQLSTQQVQHMTRDSVFTTDDMTLLRKCYEELKRQQKSAGTRSIKIAHLRTLIESKRKPSLSRAFVALVQLLPEDKRKESIDDSTFSTLISQLEILMLKKYCLHNYLDTVKPTIHDFVMQLGTQLKKKEQV